MPFWERKRTDPTLLAPSADLDTRGRQERIDRHFEIVRRRTFADAAGRIVLRAVAMTQPAAVIAFMRGRYASQMCADTRCDQPFGLDDAVLVSRGGIVGKI